MLSLLGSLLGIVPSALKLGDRIADLKIEQVRAGTEAEKIRIGAQVDALELQQQVLIAEQGSAMTRWVRPALMFPIVVFLWKIFIWDKVLGWGVTDNLSDELWWIVTTAVGAYLLTRPLEKAGQSLAARRKP